MVKLAELGGWLYEQQHTASIVVWKVESIVVLELRSGSNSRYKCSTVATVAVV